MSLIKHYKLEVADIFIFDDFLINQIHEGVIIEAPHDEIINKIVQENFSGKDMVYISNRVKSYTVDPLIYPHIEMIPNLLAIAIVPKNELMKKNAEYERTFFEKPFEIFETLNEAIVWAGTILKSHRN